MQLLAAAGGFTVNPPGRGELLVDAACRIDDPICCGTGPLTVTTSSLLARVAAGDAAAMDECVANYGGLVWSIARRFSPTRTDAEDAVQEIFIELWRVADRYDATIASEPTFIATIARRRLIDRRRRQDRRPQAGAWTDAEPEHPAPPPADWLQICEEAQRARDTMRELSTDQQQVLTLAIDGGYSQTEIAERLELPLGTVKAHARRGLIRLRELLTQGRTSARASGGAR
jgi:RNA polymerase sigma factor (sigma-70 family)